MEADYNQSMIERSEPTRFAGVLPSPSYLHVSNEPPISPSVWQRLVEANQKAVRAGWAAEGVFATGVGPQYQRGGANSFLYVGKSAGPLGHAVGSCTDQAISSAASTAWMVERRNRSPFWQLVDKIDLTRRRIAWTNICKMDRVGGQRPPNEAEWSQVSSACIAALEDEIIALSPRVILFATSGIYGSDVGALLSRLNYSSISVGFDDCWTTCLSTPDGKFAIQSRHPQGWDRTSRDHVVDLTVRLLAGGSP